MAEKTYSLSWFTTGVDEDKARIKRNIEVARPAFEILAAILKSKVVEPSIKDYQKASWPFYRADADGYNRAISDILKLIGD